MTGDVTGPHDQVEPGLSSSPVTGGAVARAAEWEVDV